MRDELRALEVVVVMAAASTERQRYRESKSAMAARPTRCW